MEQKMDTSFYSENGDNLLYGHTYNTLEQLDVLFVDHERVEQDVDPEHLSLENVNKYESEFDEIFQRPKHSVEITQSTESSSQVVSITPTYDSKSINEENNEDQIAQRNVEETKTPDNLENSKDDGEESEESISNTNEYENRIDRIEKNAIRYCRKALDQYSKACLKKKTALNKTINRIKKLTKNEISQEIQNSSAWVREYARFINSILNKFRLDNDEREEITAHIVYFTFKSKSEAVLDEIFDPVRSTELCIEIKNFNNKMNIDIRRREMKEILKRHILIRLGKSILDDESNGFIKNYNIKVDGDKKIQNKESHKERFADVLDEINSVLL